MKTSRRMHVLFLLLATLCVLGAAFVHVFSPNLVESYWLIKLRFGGDERKAEAALRLGKMRSMRALPWILREFEREPGNAFNLSESAKALIKLGAPAVSPLLGLLSKEPAEPLDAHFWSCVGAVLERISPKGLARYLMKVKLLDEAGNAFRDELYPGHSARLMVLLRQPDVEFRVIGCWALRRFAEDAWDLHESCRAQGGDEAAQEVECVVLAPLASQVLPGLVDALGDGEARVRMGAAAALGALRRYAGEKGERALEGLADDSAEEVREAAGEALLRVRGANGR